MPTVSATERSASGKLMPSCFCRNEKTSPDSPHLKQWYAWRRGETLKFGFFPPWNGHGPRKSPPLRRSFTCSPMICTMSAASRTRSTIGSLLIGAPSGELHDRHARAALVPGAEAEVGDARLLAQHLRDALAQRPGPLAVDDTNRLEVRAHRAVHGVHHDVVDLAHAHPAEVDLAVRVHLGNVATN